ETTYNYEVARTNDSAQTEYHGFSFEVPVTNDSLLSETDVSDYMYQIKDSMMVAWDSIAYEAKDLSLFDLEIEHTSGEANAMFTVHYTITSGTPRIWEPNSIKSISGAELDACSVQNSPCGSKYYYIFPSNSVSKYWINPYFYGFGTLDYSTNSINSVDCTKPGAAALLRAYGMNNYFATYGQPSRVFVPINIQLPPGPGIYPSLTSTNHDYTNRGYTYYTNADQYWVKVNDAAGHPSYVNQFYAQWLNTAMMNFYLGYIPVKLHNQLPTGKYFCDFQISIDGSLGTSSWDFVHVYHLFYSDISDLARNEDIHVSLPHF
ncbi:MAG: hypothetical protein JST27_10015, partial [Bacteroidetes bacterium]|nr:hypothetical protein [Bacteroidota bacterium]